jgi:hypothetical protein
LGFERRAASSAIRISRIIRSGAGALGCSLSRLPLSERALKRRKVPSSNEIRPRRELLGKPRSWLANRSVRRSRPAPPQRLQQTLRGGLWFVRIKKFTSDAMRPSA